MSNLPTVWTNVLAGWFMAGGGWSRELIWLELGVSLLYVAGMTLNDAFDAAWDREHAAERPIPSGAISRKAVWILGFGQLAAGAGIVVGFTEAGIVWVAALIGAILLYDWIHKKTVWSIGVMGACRALVYLVAGSAGGGFLPIPAGLILLLFVAGITLSARFERTPDGRPRLFLCWMAVLLAIASAVYSFGSSNLDVVAICLRALPILVWLPYCSQTGKEKGIGPMIGQLLAGICLLDAFFILIHGVSASPFTVQGDYLSAALFCAACLPLTLFLQRKIPAT